MDIINSNTFLAIILGVGLSAACGFRIFVPLLAISIAAKCGHVNLASGFAWMSSWTAIIAFSTATIFEILAFYIPWLDNVMDAIATPAAIVAGTVLTSSLITDISPFLKWTLAVIAGGGTAGIIQAGTVAARGASTVLTGGFGNFIVSTLELIGSLITTALAIFLPVICIFIIFIFIFLALATIIRGNMKKRQKIAL